MQQQHFSSTLSCCVVNREGSGHPCLAESHAWLMVWMDGEITEERLIGWLAGVCALDPSHSYLFHGHFLISIFENTHLVLLQ